MARLLRGSGTRYFTSSLATFQEMAILLLTQELRSFPRAVQEQLKSRGRTTTRSLGLPDSGRWHELARGVVSFSCQDLLHDLSDHGGLASLLVFFTFVVVGVLFLMQSPGPHVQRNAVLMSLERACDS